MNKLTLTRNFAHLTAIFAIILISTSVMGAGCGSSKPTETNETPVNTVTNSQDQEIQGEEAGNTGTTSETRVEIDTTKPAAPATEPATTKPTAVANTYKDGTYSATGSYNSPAGAEELPVTVTLKKDIVTDAQVKVVATNPKSKYMQEQFGSGFKQYVVGKKLNEINVGKVSGSSLTGMGFNDAITKIKAQAAVK
jgi:uncharacterized protein with FMN-binding domain